jgi:hypothetical protein
MVTVAARARVSVVLAALAMGCSSAEADSGAGGTSGVSGASGAAGSFGGMGGSPQEGELSVTFDLSNYEGPGRGLSIANETLVFPLNRATVERTVTRIEPGELVVAYTRVGCWVVPDEVLGDGSSRHVDLPNAEPNVLISASIDLGSDLESQLPVGFERETCISVRSAEGVWQPFEYPAPEATSGSTVRLLFPKMNAPADAAAIFLPTYATVSRVTYTLDTLAQP